MKQFIGTIVLFLCIAMSGSSEATAHVHPGGCNQPVTSKTTCPNAAMPGSDFCREHQPVPIEKSAAAFATCVIVDNTIPCNRVAIPGQTYCHYHESHAGPSPTMQYCGYPVKTGSVWVSCIKPPINISGRCAIHFVPTPPPPPTVPPLQDNAAFASCMAHVHTGITCFNTALPGKQYCDTHKGLPAIPPPQPTDTQCEYEYDWPGTTRCPLPAKYPSVFCETHDVPPVNKIERVTAATLK